MKELKLLFCLITLLVLSACEESVFEEAQITYPEESTFTFDAQVKADYTKASELVLRLEDKSNKGTLIFEDADQLSSLDLINGQKLRITHSDRLIVLENEKSDYRMAVGLRGDKTIISETIDNKEKLLEELSNSYTLIKLDNYVEAKNIIIKDGDLSLEENFQEKYNSVFQFMEPGLNRVSRAMAPICMGGGCGVQQCGGQAVGFFGVSVTPTQCATGFFCCAQSEGSTPYCFPCGECQGVFQGFDPCTGAPTGGGGGGGGEGGGGEGGMCIYIIDVIWTDSNGDVVAMETYISIAPC